MRCACSPFTDCTSQATRQFAQGHDGKLRARLVDALTGGDELTRVGPDGARQVCDPWAVAAEFGMVDAVEYFVNARLAKRELAAQRAAEADAATLDRSSRSQQALAARSRRQSLKQRARDLALDAHDRLVAQMAADTERWLTEAAAAASAAAQLRPDDPLDGPPPPDFKGLTA